MDDMDKAEALDAFPTSLPQSLQEKPETRSLNKPVKLGKARSSQEWNCRRLGATWRILMYSDPWGLDETHWNVLKHTAEVIVKVLLICGQKLRQSGKVPYE